MSQRLSLALLALGLVSLSGCQTARQGPAAPDAVPPPAPAAESDADLEKRAEAHARFAAGFAFDLNRQPARALDEYYLAVLSNPGDEVLALDLSRRFIQDRQFDRAAELLQKAAAEPNSTGLVSARLGYVYLQMGRTNAAIDANRMAIKNLRASSPATRTFSSSTRRPAAPTRPARSSPRPPASPSPTPPSLLIWPTCTSRKTARPKQPTARPTSPPATPRSPPCTARTSSIPPTSSSCKTRRRLQQAR